MTRQQFRLLVVLYQFVAFGLLVISELPEQFLPPEMRNDSGQSVLDAPGGSFFDDIPQLIYYATTFLNVVASIGLCFGKKVGTVTFRRLCAGNLLVIVVDGWILFERLVECPELCRDPVRRNDHRAGLFLSSEAHVQ